MQYVIITFIKSKLFLLVPVLYSYIFYSPVRQKRKLLCLTWEHYCILFDNQLPESVVCLCNLFLCSVSEGICRWQSLFDEACEDTHGSVFGEKINTKNYVEYMLLLQLMLAFESIFVLCHVCVHI